MCNCLNPILLRLRISMRLCAPFLGLIALLNCLSVSGFGADKELQLMLRSRTQDKGSYSITTKKQSWSPADTAVIVCDMWDAHHCLNAVRREEEMVPRMNEVLEKARSQGVFIIHAPSSCMERVQGPSRPANGPRRLRRPRHLPKDIGKWCRKIPAEEKGKYPIDQTDGGEDDDLKEHAEWHAKLAAMGRNPKAPWKKPARRPEDSR